MPVAPEPLVRKPRVHIRRQGVPLRLANSTFSASELGLLGKVWAKPFRKLNPEKDRIPQEWRDKTRKRVEKFVTFLMKKNQLSRAAAIDLLNEHTLHHPFLQVRGFSDPQNKRRYWIFFDPRDESFFWASDRRRFKEPKKQS